MTDRSPQNKSNLRGWLPSLGDVVFTAVLVWLFLGAAGAVALLGDGDTGWHIRTGEHILANRSFPKQDLFSFSRAGEEWFAWEWGTDVLFALVHQAGGLPGVVLLGGTLIAATSAVMFRHMIWQGSNLLVAVLVMLVASAASTIHWLARPHLFSYLFLAVTVWLLEADRRKQSRRVWLLAALSVVWTNLHGGFGALLATLGIYWAGKAIETLWTPAGERDWAGAKRYGLLFGASLAGTLANPYTYHLHLHILKYLRSDFILNYVMEFKPPNFRGEGMRHFELMLFAGLATLPALLKRRDVTGVLLLLFWAHQALTSARHVLLYVVVAGPVVARQATVVWERAVAVGGEWWKTLDEIARDYGAGRFGPGRAPAFGWLPPVAVALVGALLLSAPAKEKLRAEFPRQRFPVEACKAAEGSLLGRRVFTSDQWGDYLIYRYYPRLKVFIDGRSDFYGPELGHEYINAMNSHHQWEQIFNRHRFDVALLPAEWPLATTIKSHPDWRVKYDDGKALLFERVGPGAGAKS